MSDFPQIAVHTASVVAAVLESGDGTDGGPKAPSLRAVRPPTGCKYPAMSDARRAGWADPAERAKRMTTHKTPTPQNLTTDAQMAEFALAYVAGVSGKQLSHRFGICVDAVWRTARRIGLPSRFIKYPWTKAQDAELTARWNDLAPRKVLADDLGVSRNVLGKRARKLGLPIGPRGPRERA